MLRQVLMLAVGVVSLSIPATAGAQDNPARPYAGGYQGSRGDYYARRGFHGYPEFHALEARIRVELRDSVREDLIEPDDARDLFAQLQEIQLQEAGAFRAHGWNLPDEDRRRIHARLQELERQLDEIRAEPEG
jgi:hypothetical protein